MFVHFFLLFFFVLIDYIFFVFLGLIVVCCWSFLGCCWVLVFVKLLIVGGVEVNCLVVFRYVVFVGVEIFLGFVECGKGWIVFVFKVW